MTLERHLIDTMKEWQMKIGSLDSNIRLYYPKASLCRYLCIDEDITSEELCKKVEQYFAEQAAYLRDVAISVSGDRFCVLVGKGGCEYVENEVPEPEFLVGLLQVLKKQSMSDMAAYFGDYAEKNGTRICMEAAEDHHETVLSFEDENVDPYVYCIDDNEFGITYHRFTKDEFAELHEGHEEEHTKEHEAKKEIVQNEAQKIIERDCQADGINMVREAQTGHPIHSDKQQGEYTLEDYLTWPEEQRVELIDGVIYDMSAPTDIHQLIALELSVRFREYIKQNHGMCIPVISPIDVQLDQDDKTMVQSDVVIVCDRSKFQNGRIFGAPDLVVEVLSLSTRKKDMNIKMSKYLAAGVKEYWLVDPQDKRVIVYTDLCDEKINAAIYSFEDIVPVSLFNGKCEVDFKEIYDYVRFLYEE